MSWPSKMSRSTLLIVTIRDEPTLVRGIGPIPGISTRTLTLPPIPKHWYRFMAAQFTAADCTVQRVVMSALWSYFQVYGSDKNKPEYNLCPAKLSERRDSIDRWHHRLMYIFGVSASTDIHTSCILFVLEKTGIGAPLLTIKTKTVKTK